MRIGRSAAQTHNLRVTSTARTAASLITASRDPSQALAVIVDDLSWCELGKRLRVHACTAKRHTIGALQALAVVWH